MPHILITGASSGIGAALARRYALPGNRLTLNARDRGRLETVAAACRARGGAATVVPLDLRDRKAVRAWIRTLDGDDPIDLVIANAGVNGGHPTGEVESEDVAFETLDINLVGCLNVVLPCVTAMAARGRGQIALISSLAAYAPLADAPSYSGTKAALVAHGQALRAKLAPRGVRVNVVMPGYVKTPMGGQLKGWRPLEMSADQAAERIARGLVRNREIVTFPSVLFHLARAGLVAPEFLRTAAMRAFRFQLRPRR
ncbi:SDR family NAD(P)-dependent oxidoreductase [Methylobacterium sp. E-016]|uniref:SDR family NAD(P)-dependent oxidoreductase n=1 Tax=Methylobacterium sp. E-016 TaxID=2836556 RepID=UPI001FB95C9E|nr:SDR family NAD(P)-dependent oxidoreductase [Methylobacterium sp. E-016]MCJ2075102.1 SDR family NAD(P)-dependent oxidoreductase [Methylobacterium sp. E-016]